MRLPIIQAQSQKAQIGMDSQAGFYEIHNQSAQMEIHSTPAKLSISSPPAEINIDQSRMWEAFNGGKLEAVSNRIYSQMPDIALQAIAKIVDDGNRMGDLRNPRNPIPDIALEGMVEGGPHLQVFGPASFDNVDIHITPHKPDIQVQTGGVDVQVQTEQPDIQYQRGNVRIYMNQYPDVRFQVQNFDQQV